MALRLLQVNRMHTRCTANRRVDSLHGSHLPQGFQAHFICFHAASCQRVLKCECFFSPETHAAVYSFDTFALRREKVSIVLEMRVKVGH